MRIVSDTGPLLHLREAGSLALLDRAGPIHIPPAVQSELLSHDPRWAAERPPWVQITALDPASASGALSWLRAGLLDRGEAEALALATQLTADWFLTDDAAARMIAQHQGQETHGSLGVVLWAAATGAVDLAGAENALQALAQSSLWISARVLFEAQAALQKMLAKT
jgi:predicted nucleic acid-binding protein